MLKFPGSFSGANISSRMNAPIRDSLGSVMRERCVGPALKYAGPAPGGAALRAIFFDFEDVVVEVGRKEEDAASARDVGALSESAHGRSEEGARRDLLHTRPPSTTRRWMLKI